MLLNLNWFLGSYSFAGAVAALHQHELTRIINSIIKEIMSIPYSSIGAS